MVDIKIITYKISRNKSIIQKSSKLLHTLKTAQLYLKTNKHLSNQELLNVFSNIKENTSSALPSKCKINNLINLSHTVMFDHMKNLAYKYNLNQLHINYHKLILKHLLLKNCANPYNHDMYKPKESIKIRKMVKHDFYHLSPKGIINKGKYEYNISNSYTTLMFISIYVLLISLIVALFASGITYGIAITALIIGGISSAVFLFIGSAYDKWHLLVDSNSFDKTVTSKQLLSLINYIKHNTNKLEVKYIKQNKKLMAEKFNDNTSEIKHTNWDYLSNKVTDISNLNPAK